MTTVFAFIPSPQQAAAARELLRKGSMGCVEGHCPERNEAVALLVAFHRQSLATEAAEPAAQQAVASLDMK